MSPNDPRHGSNAGYYAHKRSNEKPCRRCIDAFNEYQRGYHAGLRHDPLDPIPLMGGRWVLDKRTRVMRWQNDPGYIEPACPKCHALPWESCRSRTGKRVEPHVLRATAQTCRCGGALVNGTNRCATCLGREEERAA